MADVFDIDAGGFHSHKRPAADEYNHRGGWVPIEAASERRKDPRLARRDDGRKRYSPSTSPIAGHHRQQLEYSPPAKPGERDSWQSPQRMKKVQMYVQQQQQPPPPVTQAYQQHSVPAAMYTEYNSGYDASAASYQHGYQPAYQQPAASVAFAQYSVRTAYQDQSYSSGQQQQHQQQQPGPPGEEYPSGWAPVHTAYSAAMAHPPPPPPVSRPQAVSQAVGHDTKADSQKKEAAIAQEMKQQRATLIKQRDEYLRKAAVLRRELDKLRLQKHELLCEKSPPRDSQRILRENAKLQLEIQNKLKAINNVVDMLSGIIGDGLKAAAAADEPAGDSAPRDASSSSESGGGGGGGGAGAEPESKRANAECAQDWPRYNYIHYDPELHWCRVCDVFPRSAKDFLTHLHSAEHRQVTHEHQLVDTPWHKLPTDAELPAYKGAPVKRVPIKGLQFFISATSWYCKLCDVWIGDLHCASLHLKSKNHAHNYSNFVEQNPHWESNWLKDREKAYSRCAKAKLSTEDEVPPAPDPPAIHERAKQLQQQQQRKRRDNKHESPLLDSSAAAAAARDKKRKRKAKRRKRAAAAVSSGSSSTSSTSTDTSSEDESDKAKSIRVAMRNKMRMQAQLILNEEIGGKLEALGRLVEEERQRTKREDHHQQPPPQQQQPQVLAVEQEAAALQPPAEPCTVEDSIINQWMTVTSNNDKHILDNLKGRLKQRQEADREKSIEAAAEQRRREREREERELRELREREAQDKLREEQQQQEVERGRERSRRRRRSGDSRSPDGRYTGSRRSRSRSTGRRAGRGRSPDRYYFREERRSGGRPSSDGKFKPRRTATDYDDDETQFDKHSSDAYKQSRSKKPGASANSSSGGGGGGGGSSSSKKLPFIGRMPLFKKRPDGEDKEIKKEDYEIRLSKFEPGNTARAFIPEPGVVHITKLATPVELPSAPPPLFLSAEHPPPPPQIIPEPPQISAALHADTIPPPPPPTINSSAGATPAAVATVVAAVEEQEVQDMELDEAAPPLPPGVPVAEAKPLAKPAGNHLPRDFQDALNIIFPGDQRAELAHADPALMMQYQYSMGYSMMYPGMQHMYDYGAVDEPLVRDDDGTGAKVEESAGSKASSGTAATATSSSSSTTTTTGAVAGAPLDDKEDLAMLGIDVEDMAAQTI